MDPVLDNAMATVLGGVMNKPEHAATVFVTIRIEDFDAQYRLVAEAIHGLRLAKADISALSIIDEMNRRGTLSRAGGHAEVIRIQGFGFGSIDYALQVIARNARVRRVAAAGIHATHAAEQPNADPYVIARRMAEQAQAVIDGIEAEGDITTPSLREFLDCDDPDHDWVVPGLLERGDRLILTGVEGLGKSTLLRQLAVCAAAGVHPFNADRHRPARVLYVDCENGPVKLRRALRPLVHQAVRYGSDPQDSMHIETIPSGLDVTRPEDEMLLVRLVSSIQPDLFITGPVYRLHAANPNDEEPARQVARVLDRCRAAANCALITEAHSGHGYGGVDRPIRPTGSSLWLRWPEFGYGITPAPGCTQTDRVVSFKPWRGDREERSWPKQLRAGGTWPWHEDLTAAHMAA